VILATYYFCVFLAAAVALYDWRKGIYFCIVLDALRDPVRKLSPDQSVVVTVVVGLVWGAVFVGALVREQDRLTAFFRAYPRLRLALVLLVAGLLPGAAMSLISYAGGWKLAAAGLVSYLAPVLGIAVGYCFARDLRDVWRLLSLYCVVNAVALSGAALEFCNVSLPGLGGIGIDWLRTRAGADAVDLICGFYRSPDVLGLHAAQTAMFAGVLAVRERGRGRAGWIAVIVWAGVCLLLSGRRKMIAMPILFAAVYLCLAWRRLPARAKAWSLATAAVSVLAFAGAVSWSGIGPQYTDYARSTVGDGFERFSHNSLGGTITTLRQAGPLGYGLGTATQGAYHLAAHGLNTWQEDGVSRFFAEAGVPGTVLIAISMWLLFSTSWRVVRRGPHGAGDHRRLQACLAGIVLANGASFAISHQAYSGDPSTVMLVAMCLGLLLSGPVLASRAPRRAPASRLAVPAGVHRVRRPSAHLPVHPVARPNDRPTARPASGSWRREMSQLP
jgi:hypothetical protein